jgi:tetratricopeptide (TPR) repeat protein
MESVELLTGLRLEPGGAAVAVDAKLWTQRCWRVRQLALNSLQIALSPFHPEPYYRRGLVYEANGELPRAVGDWTTSLRLCGAGQDLEFHLRVCRGKAFEHLNNYEQAAADLRRALELKPDNAFVLNELAWILVIGPSNVRDGKTALHLMERRATAQPHDWDSLNTLGVVYYRLGWYREAIATLEGIRHNDLYAAYDLFPLAWRHRPKPGHRRLLAPIRSTAAAIRTF